MESLGVARSCRTLDRTASPRGACGRDARTVAGSRFGVKEAAIRHAHEVEKVRAAERALMARLPEGALMARAAAGLAAVCARVLPRVYGARVVVLAGSGDNGGDALYAGERLARRGAFVRVLAADSKIHESALAALRAAGGRVVTDEAVVDDADLVIDGLVGIGGSGGLRDPHARLAARSDIGPALVVAVDVPSGVDAGTGEVAGAAVRADITVTFGTYKPGLLVDPGASHAGVVELVDIGLGQELSEPDVAAPQAADVADRLPGPTPELDKYRRGVVGIAAGSDAFVGASVLTVGGAVTGGAGMVRFASTKRPVEHALFQWPEVVTTVVDRGDGDGVLAAGRVQAWVVGPGMGTDEEAARVLRAVLSAGVPVLVDADGLTLLSRSPESLSGRAAETVLTPHAGELARLLGADRADVEARRLAHVRRAADELGATVLLKGSTTLVAEAGREVRANLTGTSRLATAGSGDVLSGLAGALLASGLDALNAASAAAYLHGLAARRIAGTAPISSSQLIEALPDAFHAITRPDASAERVLDT